MFSRISKIGGATLAVAIILVLSFPRFAARDSGFLRGRVKRPRDAIKYADYVRFFRSEVPLSDVTAPFVYRPAIPAITSIVPIADAQSAIAVVCVLFLCLTVPVSMELFRAVRLDTGQSILGAIIFAASFPVFFIGPVGILDGASIFFIALISLFMLRRKWLTASAILLIGVLVKETVAVTIVAAAAMLLANRNKSALPKLILLATAFAVPFIGIRLLIPTGELNMWTPAISKLAVNIQFRAFAGLALTLGILGAMYRLPIETAKIFPILTRRIVVFRKRGRWIGRVDISRVLFGPYG